jgi:hypothetical protein
MKKLNKSQILEALSKLNDLAGERGLLLELSIYGGVAFMLAYDSRAATKDVDAIIKPSKEGKALVAQVAKELEIHEDWLNDDVKQFIGYREKTRQLSEYIDFENLKITVPVAGYLLAMKALACRDSLPGYGGDMEDLLFLIKKMNILTVDEIQGYIDQYFVDDVLSSHQRRKLERLIEDAKK